MKYRSYTPDDIEPEIRAFWKQQRTYEQLRERIHDQDREPFYFLDGPPYTSGQVHIGTAWNKTMKDLVVRLRRMQGKAVWDRAGYDMHGLPNENATMKELGLETNEDIHEYGIAEFIEACKKRGVDNLEAMNKDFERMGVSLDFENAYQTISEEWMQAVWWLIKEAYDNERLYEGQRPMAWDPVSESVLAKHELEYKTVEDKSIYVKFKRKDAENEYFVVWTTTPWTIPFNLMIMANPELDYARIQAGEETWIVAEKLASDVCEAAETELAILETFSGEEIVGAEYEHFLNEELDYASIKEKHPNVHTVVASSEYVTTQAGSGLVHAAPGCGPEDYEVGVQNDIPAWNLLNSKGAYPQETGIFSGKRARVEDDFFTEQIDIHGGLVAIKSYVHEYPHAERSKAPVVYKATKQWFFKVDDIKQDMITANDQVHWNPQAGYNAFNSWLENLRDNSITKQRFFGTPIPLWKSEDGDVIVVGSKKELKELSGQTLKDLHKPYIDEVTITKDGKEYTRIPDVVDVWVDAGVASWACLNYPQEKELFERFWPADFIIEGNDQVRGWFNLLMVTSMLTHKKAPFRNVYMHGMIQDADGRKMSKSLGNYITPDEVIDAYGADASRLYFLGQTRAGNDLSYNAQDCQQKQRDLFVYWNIHKYLLDLHIQIDKPASIRESELRIEDRYIRSKAHSTLLAAQTALDAYEIETVVALTEELLDEISRTYIQFIRSREDQELVTAILAEVYLIALKLLAAATPYITEAIWQNLREPLGLDEQSIHESLLPAVDEKLIDVQLEDEIALAQRAISAILAARDVAQIGVRWPLANARISGAEKLTEHTKALIKEHTNVKELLSEETLSVQIQIEPDYRSLGKDFGADTGDIATEIKKDAEKYARTFSNEGVIRLGEHTITEQHLEITEHAPDGYALGTDKGIKVLLSLEQTSGLLAEGYRRELVRRIQSARKEADLDKTDEITLLLAKDLKDLCSGHEEELQNAVGATEIRYEDPKTAVHTTTETVKEKTLHFGFFTNT